MAISKQTAIFLMSGIVLTGSAATGYYMMQAPAAESAEMEPVAADPVQDPKYVDMDALVIPLVEDRRILHHIFLKVTLEVDGKANLQPVMSNKQRLHHAFLMGLYDRPIQPEGHPAQIDPATVKRIIQARADAVLGPGVVAGVHIREAVPGRH